MYPKNGVAHRSCPDMVGFLALRVQSACPAYRLETIRTWGSIKMKSKYREVVVVKNFRCT